MLYSIKKIVPEFKAIMFYNSSIENQLLQHQNIQFKTVGWNAIQYLTLFQEKI
jgi:hypothetical protein